MLNEQGRVYLQKVSHVKALGGDASELQKVGSGIFALHKVDRQKQPQGWQVQIVGCRWCAQGGEQARAVWAAGRRCTLADCSGASEELDVGWLVLMCTSGRLWT